ncbi:hypothetical protein HME9302_02144 [Alteripontixanthobacter maritimus]|uniref:Lipoprotein n=1 Tax=Alteripontixanthobacter maritimus TaxID=2161824 RepID=A0A369QCG2_9SPHN|nr:hypothetical protein [Alteripontixanthobacter maritimus]RDC60927.1 hypothetical protein HME9302_02144 [Alteripontixanthobacter maritimus]
MKKTSVTIAFSIAVLVSCDIDPIEDNPPAGESTVTDDRTTTNPDDVFVGRYDATYEIPATYISGTLKIVGGCLLFAVPEQGHFLAILAPDAKLAPNQRTVAVGDVIIPLGKQVKFNGGEGFYGALRPHQCPDRQIILGDYLGES